jgi:hypothetical protein
MTPTAVTNAGKAPARPTHRRTLPARTTPSAPRRVSGPVRGRIAQPRRAPRVRRPASATHQPLAVRFVGFVRALPDHALLDRVVRGRTWIALLGVMLVGIVAMQVEVLKLGASEGRALQEGAALASRNEILRADVSSASSEQRIERLATSYGMLMPNPADIGFLSPNATANADRAANNITEPDPTEFVSSLPADQQSSDDPSATDAGANDAASTDTTSSAAGDATGEETADGGETSGAGDTSGTADQEGTTTPTSPTAGTTTVAPVTPTAPSTTDTSAPQDAAPADAAGGVSISPGTPAG